MHSNQVVNDCRQKAAIPQLVRQRFYVVQMQIRISETGGNTRALSHVIDSFMLLQLINCYLIFSTLYECNFPKQFMLFFFNILKWI